MSLLGRYTARLRLTMLYGLLTLLTGAGVLLIAGLVTVQSSTRATVPAINHNQQPQSTASELTQARAEISHLRDQLTAQAHQANQALWHALLIGSVAALAIMAVVSVVLGWFTAHRVLRPLRRMTASYPLAALRVLALIYGHAVGLRLAGARFHPHPGSRPGRA